LLLLFNSTATNHTHTLSLHDALPIFSKSGTNQTSGSAYGYFRSDKLNAADLVAKKVLPYQNQQVGGTLGGPIVKDKIHYFASYRSEEHTSELQSRVDLVCRLLLEKKK